MHKTLNKQANQHLNDFTPTCLRHIFISIRINFKCARPHKKCKKHTNTRDIEKWTQQVILFVLFWLLLQNHVQMQYSFVQREFKPCLYLYSQCVVTHAKYIHFKTQQHSGIVCHRKCMGKTLNNLFNKIHLAPC